MNRHNIRQLVVLKSIVDITCTCLRLTSTSTTPCAQHLYASRSRFFLALLSCLFCRNRGVRAAVPLQPFGVGVRLVGGGDPGAALRTDLPLSATRVRRTHETLPFLVPLLHNAPAPLLPGVFIVGQIEGRRF